MRNILIAFFCLSMTLSVDAQLLGVCGTSVEAQIAMKQKRYSVSATRGATVYIPVKFHLVGDGDGKNRARVDGIFDALKKMNEDYKETDFQFYIDDPMNWNLINNSGINNSPFDFGSLMNSNKAANALNMFMVKQIGDSANTGVTLGYYSPSDDFVVLAQSELNDESLALSHEVGHYFSLPHTFLGWESKPYVEADHGNPLTIEKAPGSNIEVELVNGSNCTRAADGICDTPPDYNFGFGANGCSFKSVIRDLNGDTIQPHIENFMSYFLACRENAFTPGQISKMSSDYASSSRNYIRNSFTPNTTEVMEDVVLLSPGSNKKINTYNYVDLDWEDQPSADQYLVEVYNNDEYHFYITETSAYGVEDLSPNTTYFWRVRGFNDGNTSKNGALRPLKTGDVFSSSKDISIVQKSMQVFPNPSQAGSNVNVNIESNVSENGAINILSIEGKIIDRLPVNLKVGKNDWSFKINEQLSGLYLIEYNGPTTRKVRKIVIH